MISIFQVICNFLSRSKIKVKCHQNLITLMGTIKHIPTKLHQFLISSLLRRQWAPAHTHRHYLGCLFETSTKVVNTVGIANPKIC